MTDDVFLFSISRRVSSPKSWCLSSHFQNVSQLLSQNGSSFFYQSYTRLQTNSFFCCCSENSGSSGPEPETSLQPWRFKNEEDDVEPVGVDVEGLSCSAGQSQLYVRKHKFSSTLGSQQRAEYFLHCCLYIYIYNRSTLEKLTFSHFKPFFSILALPMSPSSSPPPDLQRREGDSGPADTGRAAQIHHRAAVHVTTLVLRPAGGPAAPGVSHTHHHRSAHAGRLHVLPGKRTAAAPAGLVHGERWAARSSATGSGPKLTENVQNLS